MTTSTLGRGLILVEAPGAKGDTIENLVYAPTATCHCLSGFAFQESSGGTSAPVVSNCSVGADTQMIVKASFITAVFASFSCSHLGTAQG